MAGDEAMTRNAIDLLGSRRNDAYEAAVAARSTQTSWSDDPRHRVGNRRHGGRRGHDASTSGAVATGGLSLSSGRLY